MDFGKHLGNIVRKAKGEGKALPAEFMSPEIPKSTNKDKMRRFGEWSMIKIGLAPSLEDYEYDENVGNLEQFVERYRETRKALQSLQKEIETQLKTQQKLWGLRHQSALFQSDDKTEQTLQIQQAIADPGFHAGLAKFMDEMITNVLAAAFGISKAIDEERKTRKDLIIDYQMRAREYQEAQDQLGWYYLDKMEGQRRTKSRRAALIKVIKHLRTLTLDLKRKFTAFEVLQAPLREHVALALGVAAAVEAQETFNRLSSPPFQENGKIDDLKELATRICKKVTTEFVDDTLSADDLQSNGTDFQTSGQALVERLMKDALAKIEIPTWECPKCTIENENERATCTACGTSQEAANKDSTTKSTEHDTDEIDEKWMCSSCTLENPITAEFCEACGTQISSSLEETKSEDTPPPPSKEPPSTPCALDSSEVPKIIVDCIRYLDPKDLSASTRLTEIGLFTNDGNEETVKELKLLYSNTDNGPVPDEIPQGASPHDVVALLADFFRDLSQPMFSEDKVAQMLAWSHEGDSVFQKNVAEMIGGMSKVRREIAMLMVGLLCRSLQESTNLTAEVAATYLDGVFFGFPSKIHTEGPSDVMVYSDKAEVRSISIKLLEEAENIFDDLWKSYPGFASPTVI